MPVRHHEEQPAPAQRHAAAIAVGGLPGGGPDALDRRPGGISYGAVVLARQDDGISHQLFSSRPRRHGLANAAQKQIEGEHFPAGDANAGPAAYARPPHTVHRGCGAGSAVPGKPPLDRT